MMTFKFVTLLIPVVISLSEVRADSAGQQSRYLIYSVNPSEGFNLRRDVHMRAANLVRRLREKENWTLVLPPWPHLYHWKSAVDQSGMPWREFFDVASLNRYVPSIEFEEFLKMEGNTIDEGFASILVPELLEKKRSHLRSVLLERFENILHIKYGGVEYWAARKSMVYARQLRAEGNQFMRERLGYDPGEGDGRVVPKEGGGDFLAVHLRRLDYLYAHPEAVPSLEGAAAQMNQLKQEQSLQKVFLASDAPVAEKQRLQELVEGLVWYEVSESMIRRYGDGGVAIIDQWIASHAGYFVGTAESTFSFRIREDRQFMGFSQESTFTNVCGPPDNESDPHSCERPSYWRMVPVPESVFSSDRVGASHQEL